MSSGETASGFRKEIGHVKLSDEDSLRASVAVST